MQIINAEGALATLLNILAAPGAFLTLYGAYSWFRGWRMGIENRVRAGKLLFLFGLILTVIVVILSFFISQYQLIKTALPGG